MNFIKSIFKKHLVCILSIFFLIIFAVTVRVFAVAWPYAPGATLNPGCLPTDPTCIVKGGWLLTGNAGTLDDGTYFIGTTNDIPFNIKVNNQKAGRIDSTLQNTFYGYQAGDTNTTGSDNTILGAFADVTAGTETNSIALGKGAIIDLPNQIVFGQTGTPVTNWKIAGVNYAMPGADVAGALTSNGAGILSWAAAGGGFWMKSGDNLYPTTTLSDNVGIGTVTPNEQLEITKNFRLPITTSSTVGVIMSGENRFIHNYGTDDSGNNDNTFVGLNSGNFTLTGSEMSHGGQNTALGKNSLQSLTTGSSNVAVGYNALTSNTSGHDNTAVGWSALSMNTTGIGYVGYENAAFGSYALKQNTTGQLNTALGAYTLDNNTTGKNNTAVGVNSLTGNIIGNKNTAVGQAALASYKGNNNTAVGERAGGGLAASETGNNNVFLGYEAGAYGNGNEDNALYIHNGLGVTDLATSKINSLIYGKFDSIPANQTLTINGKLGVGMAPTYELDVTGDINATGVYNSSGVAGGTADVVVKGSDGLNCNLSFIGGLYRTTTCP